MCLPSKTSPLVKIKAFSVFPLIPSKHSDTLRSIRWHTTLNTAAQALGTRMRVRFATSNNIFVPHLSWNLLIAHQIFLELSTCYVNTINSIEVISSSIECSQFIFIITIFTQLIWMINHWRICFIHKICLQMPFHHKSYHPRLYLWRLRNRQESLPS